MALDHANEQDHEVKITEKCDGDEANTNNQIDCTNSNESLESLYLEFAHVSNKINALQHQIDALNTTAKAEKHQIGNVFKKLESHLHEIHEKCLSNYDEVIESRKENLNTKLKSLKFYENSLSNLKRAVLNDAKIASVASVAVGKTRKDKIASGASSMNNKEENEKSEIKSESEIDTNNDQKCNDTESDTNTKLLNGEKEDILMNINDKLAQLRKEYLMESRNSLSNLSSPCQSNVNPFNFDSIAKDEILLSSLNTLFNIVQNEVSEHEILAHHGSPITQLILPNVDKHNHNHNNNHSSDTNDNNSNKIAHINDGLSNAAKSEPTLVTKNKSRYGSKNLNNLESRLRVKSPQNFSEFESSTSLSLHNIDGLSEERRYRRRSKSVHNDPMYSNLHGKLTPRKGSEMTRKHDMFESHSLMRYNNDDLSHSVSGRNNIGLTISRNLNSYQLHSPRPDALIGMTANTNANTNTNTNTTNTVNSQNKTDNDGGTMTTVNTIGNNYGSNNRRSRIRRNMNGNENEDHSTTDDDSDVSHGTARQSRGSFSDDETNINNNDKSITNDDTIVTTARKAAKKKSKNSKQQSKTQTKTKSNLKPKLGKMKTANDVMNMNENKEKENENDNKHHHTKLGQFDRVAAPSLKRAQSATTKFMTKNGLKWERAIHGMNVTFPQRYNKETIKLPHNRGLGTIGVAFMYNLIDYPRVTKKYAISYKNYHVFQWEITVHEYSNISRIGFVYGPLAQAIQDWNHWLSGKNSHLQYSLGLSQDSSCLYALPQKQTWDLNKISPMCCSGAANTDHIITKHHQNDDGSGHGGNDKHNRSHSHYGHSITFGGSRKKIKCKIDDTFLFRVDFDEAVVELFHNGMLIDTIWSNIDTSKEIIPAVSNFMQAAEYSIKFEGCKLRRVSK